MTTPQPVRKRKRQISIANPHGKAKRKAKSKAWSSQRPKRKKSSGRKRRQNPAPAAQVIGNLGGHVPATKARNGKKKSRGTRGGKAKRRRSTAKRQNPFGAARQHRAKAKNPSTPRRKARRGKRGGRSKNPTIKSRARSVTKKPIDMLKTGALAAAGMLATRQLPQIVLKSRNTGIVGYIANGIVAATSAALAQKWVGKPAGAAVAAGGALYVFVRILNDFTPLGKTLSLSGVGDPYAAGHLGALVPAYFPLPVVSDRSGTPIIPQAITDSMRASMPAGNGVAVTPPQGFAAPGAVSRFAGRF